MIIQRHSQVREELKMLPLVVDRPVTTARARHFQRDVLVRTVPEAELRLRAKLRHSTPVHETSDQLIVYLSGSTEPVTVYSFAGMGNASVSADLVIEQPQKDQTLLDRAFARFVGFSMEPEQPTDEDIRPHPVYLFPIA
jgi:hypothetical protein